MNLLLDECVPRRLKRDFVGHDVSTIEEAGFKGLRNGILIHSANGIFEIIITVDKNIQQQQSNDALPVGIIILSAKSNRYESLSPLVPKALEVLKNIKIGEIIIIN
jgi:predicted nuclease of predicted toxin-antitoxin system